MKSVSQAFGLVTYTDPVSGEILEFMPNLIETDALTEALLETTGGL